MMPFLHKLVRERERERNNKNANKGKLKQYRSKLTNYEN